MTCYRQLQEGFSERLTRVKNEIKIRTLIKRLYNAKDNLDKAFAEIDTVNAEIRKMQKPQVTVAFTVPKVSTLQKRKEK